MFSPCKYLYLCVISVVYYLQLCVSEPVYPPTLVLYSPGEPEYTDVLVKREHDNMTLVCEVRGDRAPRNYVWNYVSNGTTGQRPYTVEPVGATTSSQLTKLDLQVSDSGQYMCSAPPFSVTKYIIVQTKGPLLCARGAFWCGSRCVLAAYVCDGRADCIAGEDEATCAPDLCSRNDKLNCSSGRCISASACCHGSSPLCRQPACCDEYPLTRIQGFVDEYPPLYEDRHAPDDYGFIQSTIYTVTACALIFMIAVVLLVSAICKMHMKRTALRGYTHAERATSQHYTMQYAQAHRFPPCYEASRLLEENRNASPQASPVHATTPPELHCASESPLEAPRGLARLSSIFSSRYRQVPTQPEPVELQTVRSTSLQNSPTRRPLNDYRSPTYCDLNAEFLFTNPETPDLGRDLNYMATPIEFFRRRTMRRNTLERVMDQLDRQRLTLQLGRFQLSIPRFGRPDPRPDTPNVAEINIDDLDFVRLNSNDTYTLNGRTIRLLGANFENYPVMPDGSVRPPSYTEAVRYKLYGPPPEYLSREGLNRRTADTVDQEATSNIEMPPCYEDLNAINTVSDSNGNVSVGNGAVSENNGAVSGNNGAVSENNGAVSASNGAVSGSNGRVSEDNGAVSGNNDVFNGNNDISEENRLNTATNATVEVNINVHNSKSDFGWTQNESQVETLSSIIDNLPAIDSDINANDMDINNDNLVTGCVNNRSVINISADNNVISRSVINVDNGNVINNE